MNFLEILNTYGMLVIFVIQTIMAIFFLVLKDKFAPKSLNEYVSELTGRVKIIETKMDNIPSAEDIHSLDKQIGELRGDLKAVDEKFDGTDGLLKRLERQVNRMDEFWRQKK